MTLTRTMSAAAPQDKGSRTPKIFRRLEKDRKSTRLNSSHGYISYAVFCLKKKKKIRVSHAILDSLSRDLRDDRHQRLHPDGVSALTPLSRHVKVLLVGSPHAHSSALHAN